jgi:tetratricopeptide (TPR) repeat protein
MDDLDGAAMDLDRAHGLAKRMNLMAEEAEISHLRGNLCFPRGDIDGCLREHGRSLHLARTVGAPELEAAALGGLGDAEYLRGHLASAYDYFRDCIDLAARFGLSKIEVANRPMAAMMLFFNGNAPKALVEADLAITSAERVGHLRAQMIGHHAAYQCLSARGDLTVAAHHVGKALDISRLIKAPRFEAENLAFRAELHTFNGQLNQAREDIAEALAIARRTGMAYFGPIILGIHAMVATSPGEARAALAEGEALLAAGAVSHNHLLFRSSAIDACAALSDWDEVDRQADRLEAYTREEGLPWAQFQVGRARVLARLAREVLDATLARLADEVIEMGVSQQQLRALQSIKSAKAQRSCS